MDGNLGYDSLDMDVPVSPRRVYLGLSALLVLAGIGAAVGLAWAFFYRPELAYQLIALYAMALTGVVMLKSPLWGFRLWLFLIPFSPFLYLDLHLGEGIPDLSYTRVIGGFLLVYVLAQIALGKRKFMVLTFFDLSIFFFVIPLVLSAIRGYYGWLWGLQSVFDAFLMPLIIYFLARQLILRPEDFRALARTLIAITVIIAVAAIVEQATGFAPFRVGYTARIYSGDIRKVASFLGNPAYIGLALAVVAPLTIMLAIEARERSWRALYLAALMVLEAGILATFNRSALAGGFLGPLVFSLINRRLLRYVLPIILIITLLVGVSWGLLVNSSVGNRLGSESPIDYRMKALEYGLNIHKSAPYLGVGWGWFGRLAAQQGFRDNGLDVLPSPHNSYLNFLVAGGYALLGGYLIMIMGLGLTLMVLGWQRRKSRRFFPLYIQAALSSFVAYFVPIVAFDNVYARYANMIFFAIMGGAIAATLAGGSFTDESTPEGSTSAL